MSTTAEATDFTPEAAARFWAKVDKGATDECWGWAAYTRRDGYGRVRVDGRDKLAHRVAYQLANGPIPDGLFVCHSCDNKRCCNPAHLFLGTNRDNIHDAQLKGLVPTARLPRPRRRLPDTARPGASNPAARLTEEQVREIRRRYGAGGTSVRRLAKEYDISKTQIGRIVEGQRWQCVA